MRNIRKLLLMEYPNSTKYVDISEPYKFSERYPNKPCKVSLSSVRADLFPVGERLRVKRKGTINATLEEVSIDNYIPTDTTLPVNAIGIIPKSDYKRETKAVEVQYFYMQISPDGKVLINVLSRHKKY